MPEPAHEEVLTPAEPAPKRRKAEWQPPRPECQYLRLVDFPPLYKLAVSTVHRLAKRGVLPYIQVPGTKLMLFPRAKIELILKSWERNGNGRGRRRQGGS